MGLTSEHVHWAFGGAMVIAAFLLGLRWAQRLNGRWTDFIIPIGLGIFGVEMVLDPWVHGSSAPGGYAAESAQHLLLGGVLIACATTEIFRLAANRQERIYQFSLVAALLAAAAVFAFHAQHEANVPMLLLIVQHRAISATLLALAVTFALTGAPSPSKRLPLAVPMLIFVLGAQFLLYSEGQTIFGPAHDRQMLDGMPM